MKAPILMSADQTAHYASFLTSFAGKRRGSLADWLRQAAEALRNPWSHEQ
jgi:hypothetical protein